MNKSIVIPMVLVVLGLGFLVVSALKYTGAVSAADSALSQWNSTKDLRDQVAAAKAKLDAAGAAPMPSNAPEIPTIVGALLTDFQIDPATMRISSISGGDGARYSVSLDDVDLRTMALLLGRIQASYPYLTIREIRTNSIANQPGHFKWSMQIAAPPPTR